MAVLDSWRQKIGAFLLKREAAAVKRRVRAVNWEQATRVGMLFSANEESVYKTVKHWVHRLKEEGIRDIQAIGSVDRKEMPHFLSVKREFDFIHRPARNWWGRPQGSVVDNFVQTPFDILIDLSDADDFAAHCLLCLSRAGMKVGVRTPATEPQLDLMIAVDDTADLNYRIEQISFYLNILNNPQPHAASV